MARQQTMFGKNGVLTGQNLHLPVVFSVTQTLILGQADKSSPENLSFCLFVKIKSHSLIENYIRISLLFSPYFDQSENKT